MGGKLAEGAQGPRGGWGSLGWGRNGSGHPHEAGKWGAHCPGVQETGAERLRPLAPPVSLRKAPAPSDIFTWVWRWAPPSPMVTRGTEQLAALAQFGAREAS